MFRKTFFSANVFMLLSVLSLLFLASAAMAQVPSLPSQLATEESTSQESPYTVEKVQARVEEIQKNIDSLRASEKQLTSEQGGLSSFQFQERLGLFESLLTLYRRFQSLSDRIAQLQADFDRRQSDMKRDVAAFVEKKPPYSLSFYEGYREHLDPISQEIDTISYGQRFVEGSLPSLRDRARVDEQRLVALEEALQNGGASEWEKQQAELQLERDRLLFASGEKSLEESRLRLNLLEMDKKNLLDGLKWIGQNLQYDEADLNRQIDQIKEREADLQRQADELRKDLNTATEELVNAQTHFETAPEGEKKDIYKAALKEKEVWQTYYQTALDQTDQARLWEEETREIWEARYRLLQKKLPTEELVKLQVDVNVRKKNLDSLLLGLQKKQISLQSRLLSVNNLYASQNESSQVLKFLKRESDGLKKQAELNTQYMSRLLGVSMLNNRLLEEVDSRLGSVTLTEKVSSAGRERVLAFLNFQLWSGNGYTITIKKLILAVIIVLLGLLISRKVTKWFTKRLLERFEMDPTAAMAIQKGLFFFLTFLFVLMALDMVNIPLTAFAFLGGALVLGLGIGAQNFFSNLISGLILFMSKPFRLRDVVQVDDVLGTVEEIGARSTRIRTFDNVDVLVPNRYFLENRIINWNLSDQLLRGVVSVGVAYGSSVKDVERLLLQAATSHPNVLFMPEPYVVFRNFGTSALEFDLYFWLDMRQTARFKVQSDLRYKILDLFETQKVSIAFPQMDIHLDAAAPLPVTVTHGERDNRRE